MKLLIEWPKYKRLPYPLSITLQRGPGAGYIGGWTARLAFGCHAPTRDRYVIRRVQFVVTRNFNITPTFPWSHYPSTNIIRLGR